MNHNLLIIGFVWPEPHTTAAGIRMMQLIEVFQKYDFTITFVSTAAKTNNSFALHSLNINTFQIHLNDNSFDNLLKELKPDTVLFDRFLTEEQFGWRVAENCPNALRILDTEDLHFLRYGRQIALKNNETFAYKHMINDLFKRELASIYRSDLSLIISKYELDLLTQTFKVSDDILLYLPFLLESIELNQLQAYPDFGERKDFMTIGNFKHEPNWNALLYLKNTIWPEIRKALPKVQLHIYGAYATEKVKQLHNKKEGFIVKGWVENTEDAFINSRICLAPLRFGAGLKGKLIDAMKFGTPSITTKIGAEAMHDDLPWNGFICDDVEQYVQKSIALYQNEDLWQSAQQKGMTIINQCFDKTEYQNIFINRILMLQNELTAHRLHNFMGAMLQHQSLNSTKFMSKWIEEKNKTIR